MPDPNRGAGPSDTGQEGIHPGAIGADAVELPRYNVAAGFAASADPAELRRALTEAGVPGNAISLNGREDAAVLADAEMKNESASLVAGPGMAGTSSQSRGALVWAGAGAVAGAALGALVGAVLFGSMGTAVATIAGAVAGTTAGGTFGGFLRPRQKEGPRRSLQGYQVAIGVHTDDKEIADVAHAALQRQNPVVLAYFDRATETFIGPLKATEGQRPAPARGAEP